ncbi:MAG: O-antigen ligase family protein [Lachnospiraceae bacterium]|nr:O-antigen ligase family protein [Lachnospiraceae bacterium]
MTDHGPRFTRPDAVRFYWIMLFAAAPLYLPHGYIRALEDKTLFIWLAVAATGSLFICLFISDRLAVLFPARHRGRALPRARRAPVRFWSDSLLSIRLSAVPLDWAVALFGGTVLLSCLLSSWRKASFTGEKCWNVGGLLLLSMCALYFLCSSSLRRERLPFILFAGSGFFMMLLGFLNDLSMDPLGASKGMDSLWAASYTSTIGNVNTYSGCLSILLPILAAAFVSLPASRQVPAAVALFLCYLNLFLTHADSLYFSTAATLSVLTVWCMRSKRRINGWSINLCLLGLAGSMAMIIVRINPDLYLDELSPVLFRLWIPPILLLTGIAGILCCRLLPSRIGEAAEKRVRHILFLGSFALLILSFLAGILYAATHFSRDFLNRRGLIWEIAVRAFLEGGIREKLLGLGPGNLDEFALAYRHLIVRHYDGIYLLENAHNDLLEYLATTGLFGFLTYAGMYAWILFDFIRRIRNRERCSRCQLYAFAGLFGYMTQSVFNGPHPLTTAFFFGLLSLYRGELPPLKVRTA